MSALQIISAGPGVTVQDLGRPGYLGQGLSRGGAADPLALFEGAALLRRPPGAWPVSPVALEMAGFGGEFRADCDMIIALTGAPMRASLEGAALRWNASHLVPAGARLRIGAVERGQYGYLSIGAGLDLPNTLGGVSAHLSAGLGRALAAGDRLALGRGVGRPEGQPDQPHASLCLAPEDRFSGGLLRLLPSVQTEGFAPETRARFEATQFTRAARANRMGAALDHAGAPFATRGQLDILSELITPGDVQMTGEGQPFVLLPECQTTGGYPRIGTVIPADLPRAAQAGAGARLRFAFVSRAEAIEAERRARAHIKALPGLPRPLLRDPAQMSDLLSYQLVGGVVSAHDAGQDEGSA